jgi:hypothetical protein
VRVTSRKAAVFSDNRNNTGWQPLQLFCMVCDFSQVQANNPFCVVWYWFLKILFDYLGKTCTFVFV